MAQEKYTIGIDMGGTHTHVGVVGAEGDIIGRAVVPTTGYESVQAFVNTVSEEIGKLIEKNGIAKKVAGIGIGAPCANAVTGIIEAATDLPWPSPIPLVAMMEAATGLRTVITNDANAAALGEKAYGNARRINNFIMLTLGTGVGSGIVVDGHLLTGRSGFAGELGHVCFPFAADRKCGCGRFGCLQTVASAKGIVETAKRMMEENKEESMLAEIPLEKLTSRHVGEAADKGDATALRVLRFTGECIGKACASFAAFSDPEAIVLFGGVAAAAPHMLPAIREAFDREALHLYRGKVKFLTSSLPEADAAILGAASLPLVINS